jgi:hypothetical protein
LEGKDASENEHEDTHDAREHGACQVDLDGRGLKVFVHGGHNVRQQSGMLPLLRAELPHPHRRLDADLEIGPD